MIPPEGWVLVKALGYTILSLVLILAVFWLGAVTHL
jgi:hypothetical protein